LKIITLEDAIRKMTSLPAQTFGFRDRGLLRPGFAADLVIFNEKTISESCDFEKPSVRNGHQLCIGEWETVFANGA